MARKGGLVSPMTSTPKAPSPGKHLGLPMDSKPTDRIDSHNQWNLERGKHTKLKSPLVTAFKMKKT